MWTVSFWRQAAERAVKSLAQGLLVAVASGASGLLAVGWRQALDAAGLMALASLLTSVVSSGVGPSPGPSLVSTDP